MGLNLTNPLIQELHVRYFDRELRRESVLEDPFTHLRGVYTPDKRVEIPNATMMILDKTVPKGARHARIPLCQNLAGAPQEGTAINPVGLEEDLLQKYFDVYYNDISHVVALQEYGIEAETKDYYKIFEEITPKEALYWKEQEGKYIRECLLERFSQNLTVAPRNLIQEFSPNICICGRAPANWPVYNNNPATWTNLIAQQLVLAGTGAGAACNMRFLMAVEEWATSGSGARGTIIEPIVVDNKETYILVLPTPQARWMRDPIQANGIGTIYRDITQLTVEEMKYPNVIARIGKLLVVEDPRYPTLTLGGSGNSRTLTPQYRLPGNQANSDPRDKTINARQVGYLLGRTSYTKWMPEDFHWEYEYERYDKFAGQGIFASAGWVQTQYDFGTTATSATRYQNGSAVLLFAVPPAVI